MPEPFEIHCTHCRESFTVEEAAKDQFVNCPKCGEPYIAARPDSGGGQSKLNIKDDERYKTCPSCGEEIGGMVQICVHCGYDYRTGRRVSQTPKWVWIMVGALVLLAGVILFAALTFRLTRPAYREAPPGPAGVVTEAPAPEAEPVPTPEPLPADPAPEGVPENRTPGADFPDRARSMLEELAQAETGSPSLPILERALAEARKALDARHPVYEPGSLLTLELKSGIRRNGRITEVKKSTVVLVAGDREFAVPLADLKQGYRIRLDQAYREGVILRRGRETALEGMLEEAFPYYRPGDDIRLTGADGEIIEGVLLKTNERAAMLRLGNAKRLVHLADLDRHSRMFVDPAFRSEFIRFLVRKQDGSPKR